MIRLVARRLLGLWLLMATLLLAGESRAAAPSYFPSYVLLRPPVSSAPAVPTHGHYPGCGIPVQTHAYSYGWFGARPRQHWTLHHGYYGNHTQWSER